MAGPGLKPVGVSTDPVQVQPQHLALQVQIPKQAITKTPPKDEPRRDDGWNRQESIVESQANLHHERSATWRRFQHGRNRRSNYGAVLIDGPRQPRTLAPTTAEPPVDGNGWQRIDRMHARAALFEEKNRPNMEQLGADSSLDVDSSGAAPVSRGGRSGPRRRRFRLA